MNDIEKKFIEVQFEFMTTLTTFFIKEYRHDLKIKRAFEHMEKVLRNFTDFYREFKSKTK